MALRRLFMLGMVGILATSCVTRSLWKATDPLEYVSVPQNEVSESELQERGVRYRKDDKRGLYYVEKTSLQRFGNYTIRMLATPATVVLDVAPVIVVIGAIAIAESELEELHRKSGGDQR